MSTAGTTTPANFRNDAVAFAYQVTSTGSGATGSLWVEYNVEFASPKVPDPPFAMSLLSYSTSTSSPALTTNLSPSEPDECPVPQGQTFYAGLTNGSLAPQSGYRILSTPVSDSNMKIYEIINDTGRQGGPWATITGVANTAIFFATSSAVAALQRLLLRMKSFQ